MTLELRPLHQGAYTQISLLYPRDLIAEGRGQIAPTA